VGRRPPSEYEDDQDFPFSISFVTPKTVRLRLAARPRDIPEENSLMLDGEPPTGGPSWEQTDGSCMTYAVRSDRLKRSVIRFTWGFATPPGTS
jgi:hypothetical protein